MKALMYHYVRPAQPSLPHFRYLHVDHFEAQLEYVERRFGLMGREDYEAALTSGDAVDGVILTFDDGFLDHYKYVIPRLLDRGLWGIFYVPTGMYSAEKLLDVHRVHLLLGRLGGTECLQLLADIIDESMMTDEGVEAFRTQTYVNQSNDEATLRFKRMLNFFVSYRFRETVLDALMADLLDGGDESQLVSEVYMSEDHISQAADAGMVIGSHSVSHRVMSKLTVDEQRREIRNSMQFLEGVIGRPVETFCYPHGGFHTFTAATERLLCEEGVRYSFNVEPRDIEPWDVIERPQALPRYDCNLLPFGAASLGPVRAEISVPR